MTNMSVFEEHEHVFTEEQEPGGRLILPPCMVCGLTALDAIESAGNRLNEINLFANMLEEGDSDPYDEKTVTWVAEFLTVLLDGATVRDVLRINPDTGTAPEKEGE